MPFADPEQQKTYQREYGKRWYQKNKEKKAAQRRANYLKTREAQLAKNREWEKANRESVNTRKRLAYRKNRERILAKLHANPEPKRARGRAYAKANRDKFNANKQKRRAAETRAGGSYTARQWNELVARYEHSCLRCGRKEPEIKLSADHVIPIILGGTSDISNMQPLCLPCNKSKGPRAIDYRVKWLKRKQTRTIPRLPNSLPLFSDTLQSPHCTIPQHPERTPPRP